MRILHGVTFAAVLEGTTAAPGRVPPSYLPVPAGKATG
ncbi:hypothetical protein J2T22_001020 [Pseudarthrobacter defluvii]|uniref:Uncharacterized protein n=1 Tax=Pseudarthrobacter defluvii TaxID=410837 RepID=A0ABT9UDX7_9MICC|nr:hypothetical protein [Pseudarthrobacter defluvii]